MAPASALGKTSRRMSLMDDGTLKEPVVFKLCLYRSGEGWRSRMVQVAEPRRDRVCPVAGAGRYHETTKAITLGGPRGTVGWVDLCRSILVLNVFDGSPVLHDVPLPPPARGNWVSYAYHKRCSFLIRDITVSRSKDCIKYIEMETALPRKQEVVTAEEYHPPETYLEWFHEKPRPQPRCAGWRATTWSMPVPILSWEDWSPGCTVNANEIVVKPMHSKLLPGSISDSEPTEVTLLPVLTTAFPTMSMDDDVVYLLSKACSAGEMEVVIAVDLRKKTLRGVGKVVAGKDFTDMRSRTTEISKYLNLNMSAEKP
uniref:Uncharacterized protein n=1 Tax=Aegilops tauschii TaxID=37682 RepID=M8BP57_AEGTA